MKFSSCVATFCAFATLADAFTPVAPPSVTLAPPATEQLISTSSSLPSQRELLEKASFSTNNLAAATATATPAAAATPAPKTSSVITITDIKYDGQVPKTESDEYVVIANSSKGPIDISGYYVYVASNGSQGPTFYFPKNSIIKPGQVFRIYTNEVHKETGGYSFGYGRAIWNNKGGLGVLRDSKGTKLCEFKYKGEGPGV